MKIGILGGGLTALVIGSELKHQYEILEKENSCGGLCRTIIKNGYSWDYGGAHILFSKNKQVLDIEKKLLQHNLCYQKRNNKIYYKGYFVKYPFENGLSDLPYKENFQCLHDYIFNNNKTKLDNLADWFYFTFGKSITEKYLIPYNKKIWNTNPKRMDVEWVERIPKPPLIDIIKSSLGFSTEGYTHQLHFLYPKTGGIQSLIKAYQKNNHGTITTSCKIFKITKKKNTWILYTNLGIKEYDKIISTIPLPELVSLLEGITIPKEVKFAATNLLYNSEINILLGLSTPNLNNITAMYLPDEDFLPNRISFPPNFSPLTVPENKFSCTAEIIVKPQSPILKWSDDKMYDHVIKGLKKRNIIKKNSVVFKQIAKTKYAYVVYDKKYSQNMHILQSFFKNLGISLCGRFGEFAYLNTDVCIEKGMNLGQKLNCELV